MKQPSIVIVDYGVGNIFSVNKALNKIGYNQVKVSRNKLDIKNENFTILDAIEKLELVKSRSEIKRLIKSNGIRVNDELYKDNNFSLKKYLGSKEIKISVGKKKIGILKIV